MIVTQTDTGWQIINQQAHGLLAVQVALHWRPDSRPVNWIETLIALTEHDDGQDAWEGRNHLTTAGAPLHFQLLQYSVEQCRKLIQIGLQKSRWNALLMSMHTSFLYEPKRGTDKELDEFLDQQVTNQTKWRKEIKATKKEADYAYAFLQWCDALSLVLCMDQVPPESRRLEVSLGPDGIPYYIHQRTDASLSMEPWPFDTPAFAVHVETFLLDKLVFKNDKQLYTALQNAPVGVKEWTFREK
ncbi:DUF3891 family protein [Spirosoma radiotolerans]|uniref:DUF3891 domain-containing protein n=1 Tax=Spirosoma radiotolerans TaxID=1379870 RepID=A0A0E3V8X8_9BACT|nr:DUF3891 family protein [Spirosoma radiotolerans]AKD56661.1 hypothetical protein SD10_18905 [Spirosoma radiotolerans]